MRACFEQQGYVTARYAYPAGTVFPAHAHDCDKLDGVLAGRLEIAAAGQRWILAAGDSLYLPAGLVHSARVLGAETVISIDATRRG